MIPEPAQYASQILAQLGKGELMLDVGESLADCVRATTERRKPSKLTITIEVAPGAVGDDTVVMLKGDVKISIPPVAKGSTVFFADVEHVLHRIPPNQANFFSGPREAVAEHGADTLDTTTGELRPASEGGK